MKVNREKFEEIAGKLESETEALSLDMVAEIFGPDFLMLVIYCLMDSADAARAIAGAINRLARGENEGSLQHDQSILAKSN